ncbi:MAG: 3-phosphoglycerate dehydrogenase [Candidatus Thermoplasmatota archaeon]|nr:3-phosphoglycerate dehydrogenase [Candidatus Thermoplasmatota archaeon]
MNNEKKFKIIITDPVDAILLEKLREKDFSVDYYPKISEEDLLNIINQYNGIVVRSRTKVTKDLIDRGKELKFVARAGVGLDGIDLNSLQDRKISIIHAPEASTSSVAELTFALMLGSCRRLPELAAATKLGNFSKEVGTEISGKTFGLIGFGRIGYKVAEIARAFDMSILAYDVITNDRINKVSGQYVALDDLVQNSDFIGVFVTIKPGDKPILGKREFSLSRKKPGIINTSRAAAIDGPSLLEALKTGTTSFYASDVMWNEPPKTEWEHELLSLPQVIITPHIGAQTREAQARIAEATAARIIEMFGGVR